MPRLRRIWADGAYRDRLVRWDQNAGTTFTVARHVSGFAVQDLGGRVQIQLTFTYRGLTRTYTLVARDP